METDTETDKKYLEAKRRVKKMKGFYIHALVFVLVNLFIIAQNVRQGEPLDSLNNYYTAIFWGIGLLAHGVSVFVPGVIFGRKWEERKIRELMDRYK